MQLICTRWLWACVVVLEKVGLGQQVQLSWLAIEPAAPNERAHRTKSSSVAKEVGLGKPLKKRSPLDNVRLLFGLAEDGSTVVIAADRKFMVLARNPL
jgi:hypothetical protein